MFIYNLFFPIHKASPDISLPANTSFPGWSLDELCTTEILSHVGPSRSFAQTSKYFYEIHKKASLLWAKNLLHGVDGGLRDAFKIPPIDEQHPYESSVTIMNIFKSYILLARISLFETEEDSFKKVPLPTMLETPEKVNKLLRLVDKRKLVDLVPCASTSERAKTLTAVAITYQQLTSLPASIWNLTALIGLNLGGNQLTSLPESIGNLTALEWLLIFNNNLTSLPKSLEKLTKLRVLTISDNRGLAKHPPLHCNTSSPKRARLQCRM